MNIAEFLTNLTKQGVQFWEDNHKLKINSPPGILTPQIQLDIAANKAEILTFLRGNDISISDDSPGLKLQTIGGLISGYSEKIPHNFKSPIIDPQAMAKQLKVTFRPLPTNYKNESILKFRTELEQKLQDYQVQIIPWEQATRELSYEMQIPVINWRKRIITKAVKADIHAVIDVERPIKLIGKIKSWIAEKYYQIYSSFIKKNQKISVAKIAQLIGWAEDHVIQQLEDPTSTQVILITELDQNFVNSQLAYQQKIAIGVNTLVKTFSEIVIGVSSTHISILNMNLSDALFAREKFDNFVLKSLIPKIYVPIAPLPISQFKLGEYTPNESKYAAKLGELSKELANTGLYPSGFKLSEVITRKSHQDIVNSIVNGRTGVSYGFVAYAEPPQYFGAVEISQEEWKNLLFIEGYSSDEIRQNNRGRKYLKTKIKNQYIYRQIPDIWLVCSRSGSNKTDLNLERDILRIGLKNQLYLQFPTGINPYELDIKPSYDTYVMIAIALSAALYTPELIKHGAPIIHFHGYPAKEWFQPNEYYAGFDHPSVPCGTYESGVFNFLSIHQLAEKSDNKMILASLIEPDHGTNIITSDPAYLLSRLQTGIQDQKIELGGKYFASLR